DNFTFDSTSYLKFEKGGLICIPAGKTLKIKGPIFAGMHQIFTGDGSVDLSGAKISEIHPEWFGAKGNLLNDDTQAIQKAINSIESGHISLSNAGYLITNTINIKPGIKISGSNSLATYIKMAPGHTVPMISRSGTHGQYIYIKDLFLDGNNSATDGIYLSSMAIPSTIDNVTIISCTNYGLHLYGCDESTIKDVYVNYCGNSGIFLDQCTQLNIINCASERSGTDAIKMVKCDLVLLSDIGIEQTEGTSKNGLVLDACIGIQVNTLYAYGIGSQGSAVKISNASAGGRTSRILLQNLTSTSFAKTLEDSVSSYTQIGNSELFYSTDGARFNGVTNIKELHSQGFKLVGGDDGGASVNYGNGLTGSTGLYFGGTTPVTTFLSTGIMSSGISLTGAANMTELGIRNFKLVGYTDGGSYVNYGNSKAGSMDFFFGGTASKTRISTDGIENFGGFIKAPSFYSNNLKMVGYSDGGVFYNYGNSASGSAQYFFGGTQAKFIIEADGISIWGADNSIHKISVESDSKLRLDGVHINPPGYNGEVIYKNGDGNNRKMVIVDGKISSADLNP
ncbi:MAG: right-handed parallel beta-helix repeat-containing protein, partial [Syntrophothermus sp.]